MHLLRLLESVVTEAPSLFAASHDGEVNLVRVIEVLIHLLKRISSSAVCLLSSFCASYLSFSQLYDAVLNGSNLALFELKRILLVWYAYTVAVAIPLNWILSPVVGALMTLVYQHTPASELIRLSLNVQIDLGYIESN